MLDKCIPPLMQYPGVAQSINSDIDNLVGLFKVWNVLPEGLFIDHMVEVARRELTWEVDYLREAQCTDRFRYAYIVYICYILYSFGVFVSYL